MILVTGGAGYIGSHCVLSLLEKGHHVLVYDNLSTGHLKTIQILNKYGNLKFTNGDLLDCNLLQKVFDNFDIEAVIHFAAFSRAEESMFDPQKYYTNNIVGTLNLLKVMLSNNVKQIIFSSSAAVYGEPIYTPIDEKHPLNPINTYGQTKLIIEKILEDYGKAYHLKSVSLRYFNVVGCDSIGRIGECHEPETHLIPNILKNNNIFEIYGNDYDTKDGTCIRDYVDIEDLVNAHLLALEYLKNGGKTNCFNIGTKEGNTVKEIFKMCEDVCNKAIPLKIMPRRKGDPAVLVASNEKAKEYLGWYPQKDLEESIKNVLNWQMESNL